jgi:hypothetical protein
MIGCALVVAVRLKLPPIYYYIVVFLGKFGTLFIIGLVSVRFSQMTLHTFLFNPVLLVVTVLRCGCLLCISFGMLQRGKYGKKEITVI